MPDTVKYILCLLLLLVTVNSVIAAPEGPAEFTLDELMQSLAAAGDTKANYAETRSSRLSKRLIKSSGTLEFIAPDVLIRRIVSPRAAVYEVRGDSVIIERGGKLRSRSLEQLGAVRGFIESLRGTLAGDLPELEKYYQLGISGGQVSWQLELTPKSPALAEKIKQIIIQGGFSEKLGGMRVTAVRIEEDNGNLTNTKIIAID